MKAPRKEMCDALGEGSKIVSKVVLGKVRFQPIYVSSTGKHLGEKKGLRYKRKKPIICNCFITEKWAGFPHCLANGS